MRLLATTLKNSNVLICLFLALFSCKSSSSEDAKKAPLSSRMIPEISCPTCKNKIASGFVLWLSQEANFAALVVFNEDTNGDGKIYAKVGEHGELLEDAGKIAWVNTESKEIAFYDSFLGSDPSKRTAILKRADDIFLINTLSGKGLKLEGAEAKPDNANPCLPSREAVLSSDGDRVVYPLGPTSYRSLHLQTKKSYDVNTEFLLWRVKPKSAGEEVFEMVTDRDNDGMAFPKSQSTCACDWCPRFARSVGNYGSVGDEIRKSIYTKGIRKPSGKTPNDCKVVGKNDGAFDLLECNHSLFRVDRKTGAKTRIDHKIKIPSYENPTLDGWFPVLVLGAEGMHMGRYNVETNIVEQGPAVNRYAKKTHTNGFWLGRSKNKNIVWSLRSNQFKTIEGLPEVTVFKGLVANTKKGKYVVNGFSGAIQKLPDEPTWTTSNGCVLFRAQTHRISPGPWNILCANNR